MARHRDTFASALSSLRLRAHRGEFAPGQSVVVVEEARRLRMSPTPVREALACLCGEGLIERSPSEGFVTPRLDVAVIRDRFRFRLKLLQISLETTSTVRLRAGPAPLLAATALDHSLARLVRAHGNVALYEAYRRVASQLAPVRASERRVLADLEAEASELATILSAQDRTRARHALDAYHQRRIEAAPHLLLDLEWERFSPEGSG